MLKYLLLVMFYATALILSKDSCNKHTAQTDPPVHTPATDEWLIARSQVFEGGPGKDGIPSIDNPKFIEISKAKFLEDDDLVILINDGDMVRIYPHMILDWHEIVNDGMGDKKFALTYCPLTGTGIAWNRMIGEKETTFGVSGLLYNTNLMPYDRSTNSTWSQQRLDCVNGELIGTKSETFLAVETSFKTARDAFPDAMVLSTETRFNRTYGFYPYGDYRSNHDMLLFPISTEDKRLPQKERALGVLVDGKNKVYTFGSQQDGIEMIRDSLRSKEIVVVRSVENNFIVAFEDPGIELKLVTGQFPAILKDHDDNLYNLLGMCLNRPEKSLTAPTQFIGYWFSWGTFYPGIEIVE